MSRVAVLVRPFRMRLLGNFVRNVRGLTMTKNANFKRRVRARAAKTGESYTAALRQLHGRAADEAAPAVQSIRLAVAQTTSFDNPLDSDGLRRSGAEIRQLMREAQAAGARLVHFAEGATCAPNKRIMSASGPETVGPSDWTRFEWAVLREELEGTRRLAGELGIWTVIGSVHQLTEPHRPHNSLYVMSDSGHLVTRYDERMLSNTKISFMYTPGGSPVTFDVDGFRFGCALGMEAHFPEIFIEYERLDVDCVLFSTTDGASPGNRAFAVEVQGHAASHRYWVSLAALARPGSAVPSGIAAPGGQWAACCATDGMPSLAVVDISDDPDDLARPWRRRARTGLYEAHRVADDPRSIARDLF